MTDTDAVQLPHWVHTCISNLCSKFNIDQDEVIKYFEPFATHMTLGLMTNDELREFAQRINVQIKKTDTRNVLLRSILYNQPEQHARQKRKQTFIKQFEYNSLSDTLKRLEPIRVPHELNELRGTEFKVHPPTGYVFYQSQVIAKLHTLFSGIEMYPLTIADIRLCKYYRFDTSAWTTLRHNTASRTVKRLHISSCIIKDQPISYDADTGFVLDKNNIVTGKLVNSNIEPLGYDDIRLCQEHNILFRVPIPLHEDPMISEYGLTIKVDVHGNEHAVDSSTNYVVYEMNCIVGRWNEITSIVDDLTEDDIIDCKQKKLRYRLPVGFKDAHARSQEHKDYEMEQAKERIERISKN